MGKLKSPASTGSGRLRMKRLMIQKMEQEVRPLKTGEMNQEATEIRRDSKSIRILLYSSLMYKFKFIEMQVLFDWGIERAQSVN